VTVNSLFLYLLRVHHGQFSSQPLLLTNIENSMAEFSRQPTELTMAAVWKAVFATEESQEIRAKHPIHSFLKVASQTRATSQCEIVTT